MEDFGSGMEESVNRILDASLPDLHLSQTLELKTKGEPYVPC